MRDQRKTTGSWARAAAALLAAGAACAWGGGAAAQGGPEAHGAEPAQAAMMEAAETQAGTQPEAAASQPSTQPEAAAQTAPSTQAATESKGEPSTRPAGHAQTQGSGGERLGEKSGARGSTAGASHAATQGSAGATTQPKGAARVLQPLSPVHQGWDTYKVIYTKNMFTQQHKSDGPIWEPPPASGPGTAVTQPVPVKPLWILTGVVVLDDDRMAFMENVSSGVTSRARVGDLVGDGKVTAITADWVDVQVDGKSVRVNVGASLDGRSVEGVLRSGAAPVSAPVDGGMFGTNNGKPGAGPGSGGGVGPPSAPGTSDEAAIRERLKRRRAEENK